MVRGIIYKYVSPNGKIYIGQTTEEKRRRKTFFNLNKSYGGDKIDAARHKYSPENFDYEILFDAKFLTKKEATQKLDELEEYYIRMHNSYRRGYNMTYGGYTTRGYVFSPEQKKEMSIARTGRKTRPRTEDEKAQQSVLMKKKWETDSYRKLREEINKSESHKLIVSESLSGKKNGMYGKKHTEESRTKMSESRSNQKNIWFGKEKPLAYRQRIRQSLILYHEKHLVSEETKDKISKNVSIPVCKYSIEGNYLSTYLSATVAGQDNGVDPSCIIKCCKRRRKSAGGFIWKYKNEPTYDVLNENSIDVNVWIDIAEAMRLTNMTRNVIYYHIKHHNVPILKNGRRLRIHKPSLLAIKR